MSEFQKSEALFTATVARYLSAVILIVSSDAHRRSTEALKKAVMSLLTDL
jgi:hypothetical protein